MQAKPAWGLTPHHKPTTTFAGGAPYSDGSEWPVDEKGHPLVFLLQVDLSEVPELGLSLPTEGFLQFFTGDDEFYGMTFGDYTESAKRVKVRLLPPTATPTEEVHEGEESPLTHPGEAVYYRGALVWQKPQPYSWDYLQEVGFDDENPNAEEEYAEAYRAPSLDFYLGGYPLFTQEDFRGVHPYENITLLLGSSSSDRVMWGDLGEAGFWVADDLLDEQDYSEAFLYWDCS